MERRSRLSETKSLFLNPFRRFVALEASSGILLFAAAVIALVWGNSIAKDSYFTVLEVSIFGLSLLHWINDGLMALFFLVVGLEIKREFTAGELSKKSQALLPMAAALGGMIVPALIYCAFNRGTPNLHGWGITMATDIAFSLGVLTLLGKRVPFALKVFLTAFAIVDDLGAVLVIALFYTVEIGWLSLFSGLALLGVIAFLFVKRPQSGALIWLLVLVGSLVWFLFLKSGIHPTIAGVLLALIIPKTLGGRIEAALHPWVSFGILPLFALANAGVALTNSSGLSSVSSGIVFGLFIGKQIGILLFTWAAIRLGFASLPARVTWKQMWGVASLGGIGFTMSLFIAGLAFRDPIAIDSAKIGILAASVFSGLFGGFILFVSSPKVAPAAT